MIGLSHIAKYAACLTAVFFQAACATQNISPSQLEAHPNAITVPYRLSEAGHLLIDVAVNGREPIGFIIDSGANGSAVYDSHLEDFGLTTTDNLTAVHGLVTSAKRPFAETTSLQIGTKHFPDRKLVILETPTKTHQAAGLIGVDVFADYALVFNADTSTVSFIPSADLERKNFTGWRRITLRNQVGGFPDRGLYFATLIIKGRPVPVLIDTGSDLNIVNWPLAQEEESVRRIERSLRKTLKLQGALETVPLRMKAQLHDVLLDNQAWPKIQIVVMEFDSLNSIAPVDGPMMIAGANMFTATSFAFDFGGNAIYIHKGENKP